MLSMPREAPPKYVPPPNGYGGTWEEKRHYNDGFSAFPTLPHETDTHIADEKPAKVDTEPTRDKPVRVIVDNPTRDPLTSNNFATQFITIQPALGRAIQIVNRRSNRTLLRVLNITAGKTVWIGDTGDVTDVHDGYPVLSATGNGDAVEMHHQREVWAYNPDAVTAVTLGLYWEYTLELE
jgi:hypothetical protein